VQDLSASRPLDAFLQISNLTSHPGRAKYPFGDQPRMHRSVAAVTMKDRQLVRGKIRTLSTRRARWWTQEATGARRERAEGARPPA